MLEYSGPAVYEAPPRRQELSSSLHLTHTTVRLGGLQWYTHDTHKESGAQRSSVSWHLYCAVTPCQSRMTYILREMKGIQRYPHSDVTSLVAICFHERPSPGDTASAPGTEHQVFGRVCCSPRGGGVVRVRAADGHKWNVHLVKPWISNLIELSGKNGGLGSRWRWLQIWILLFTRHMETLAGRLYFLDLHFLILSWQVNKKFM